MAHAEGSRRLAAAARAASVDPHAREQLTARGPESVSWLRHAVRQGNVLRIWIKGEDGRTLIEIPLRLGVRGGRRLARIWAAVSALASASGVLTVVLRRETGWPAEPDRGSGSAHQAPSTDADSAGATNR